jgi:hypothetical protein
MKLSEFEAIKAVEDVIEQNPALAPHQEILKECYRVGWHMGSLHAWTAARDVQTQEVTEVAGGANDATD